MPPVGQALLTLCACSKFEQVETTGTRPCGRSFHSSIWVDDTKMVVFGGLGKPGSLDDCFEYNVADAQWGILFPNGAVKPKPRYGHTMTETIHAGIVLLYGGAGAGFFDDLFTLDTRTGQWSAIEPNGTIPASRAFHSAVALERNTKMVPNLTVTLPYLTLPCLHLDLPYRHLTRSFLEVRTGLPISGTCTSIIWRATHGRSLGPRACSPPLAGATAL